MKRLSVIHKGKIGSWTFTTQIIARSVWPGSWCKAQKNQPTYIFGEGGFVDCSKMQLSDLGNLRLALNGEQRLKLYFRGCKMLAAPFLLFRLKRQGFSNCRATVTQDGIYLSAES